MVLRNVAVWLVVAVGVLHDATSISAVEMTRYETASGWKLLFDGKTTSGWRNYQSDETSAGWSVSDGVLSATRNAGDLITNEQYANFELSLEYRIASGGNSGVLFHVTEEGKKPWHSGPELQILDTAHKGSQKAGFLYDLYTPERPRWSQRVRKAAGLPAETVDATRPAGEWNQIYLRVCESQCQVALNGHAYFRFKIGSEDWNQRVAKSKFAKFDGFGKAKSGHICLQEHGSDVAFRNIKIRELNPDGTTLQQPIDGKLDLVGEPAFPNLEWEGWEPVDDDGRNMPLRFMELTHAGDSRLFAAAQKGQIFCFENDPKVEESSLFLDIVDKVAPWRKSNEEGLLGLAFHPKYQQNGYFYVYYSVRDQDRLSRISRFQASRQDPNVADPDSEQVVLEVNQAFKNHNGGAIEFGPDGFLYIALGDGGDMNDPHGHGQNRSTLLGSLLRIDVDRRDAGKSYAIPTDNPFVGESNARPEIYAFGFRNPWRIAFDSQTGELWLGDVGQDLWEEVNIVRRGGNYGWSMREGSHAFGNAKTEVSITPVEPVWEYDHRVGKSITGGRVYRGDRVAELNGKYLYADYVAGRVWALEYDASKEEVVRNLEISDGGITVTSFGEDREGEVYYMVTAANGQCIYRFVKK